MPDIVLNTVRATAAGVALFFGMAMAAVPAYAGDDPTPSPPAPSAEQTPAGHEHSDEHGDAPTDGPSTEPAEVDEHEGHDGGHTPPAEPAEPADRPRAWVFGGFAAVNGVALVYAAWLRRRTAADRDRRTAARTAAQAPEGSSR